MLGMAVSWIAPPPGFSIFLLTQRYLPGLWSALPALLKRHCIAKNEWIAGCIHGTLMAWTI